MSNKIRVLVAKPGLDGHDRGAKVVLRGLRDVGMEVIYLGLRVTPEQIVEAAIQEDVNVVGLSCLSGAHMSLFPKTMELLRKKGPKDETTLTRMLTFRARNAHQRTQSTPRKNLGHSVKVRAMSLFDNRLEPLRRSWSRPDPS